MSGLTGYHESVLLSQRNELIKIWPGGGVVTQFKYTFRNFFHPFVGELISKLNKDSLAGVMDAAWQNGLCQAFFDDLYKPTQTIATQVVSFPKQIDVEEHGPYANYNWELFYHIPLTVAVHLSKTRRFAEAQRWFHFIFDPTSNDQSTDPKRFWKFLAFRKDNDPKQIDYLLTLLSKSPSETLPEDQDRRKVLDGYKAMLDSPFHPHAIARTRHLAYQYSVVMKYLDNLIAWGDDLFQQDTIETLNEATLLYVLAANILGPRPERIPPFGTVKAKTFADLKAAGIDKMGNALVDLEAAFPFNMSASGSGRSDGSGAGPLFGIGRTLYFCIPRNDKLLNRHQNRTLAELWHAEARTADHLGAGGVADPLKAHLNSSHTPPYFGSSIPGTFSDSTSSGRYFRTNRQASRSRSISRARRSNRCRSSAYGPA